jgi:hypothetical protein
MAFIFNKMITGNKVEPVISSKTETKVEHTLPSLENISEIPKFFGANTVKIDSEPGFIIMDGVKRKLSKASSYLMDIISTT